MTDEQEAHLSRIQFAFATECSAKYRKGQAEHGGDLFHKDNAWLLQQAIDEAIDQFVYLITLKERLWPTSK